MNLDMDKLKELAQQYSLTLAEHKSDPLNSEKVTAWDCATHAFSEEIGHNAEDIICVLIEQLEAAQRVWPQLEDMTEQYLDRNAALSSVTRRAEAADAEIEQWRVSFDKERGRTDKLQAEINRRNAYKPVAILDVQKKRMPGDKFAVVFTPSGHAMDDGTYEMYVSAPDVADTQHNGMMQLSHELAETKLLLSGTQEKLGKALSRNSEMAAQRGVEYGDAYQWAREDLAIWKHRALEAEAELKRRDEQKPSAEIKWDGSELSVQNVAGAFLFGVTRVYAAAPTTAPDRNMLRDLVDVVWNHVTESTAVPGTETADELINKVFSIPAEPIESRYSATPAAVLPPEIK